MYVIMCNIFLFRDYMTSFSVVAEDWSQPHKGSVPILCS